MTTFRCTPRVVSEFLIMEMNENKLIHGYRRLELATGSCRINSTSKHRTTGVPFQSKAVEYDLNGSSDRNETWNAELSQP